MAKLTLDPVSNVVTSPALVATLESNFDKIETAIENTISRDGKSPNQMLSVLDMNSNRIINLPPPLEDGDPARLQDIKNLVYVTVDLTLAPLFNTVNQVENTVISPLVQYLQTAGYSRIGVGAARYKKVGSQPSHPGKIQSDDGAWWEIAEPIITPAMLGAVSDGITDDSAIVQATNDAATALGVAVSFPAGRYAAANLNMTAPWRMDPGAEIIFNGVLNGNCITVNANGLRGCSLHISGDGKSPGRLVNITGNNNHFSRIIVRDITSPADPNPIVALRISGNNNTIGDVVGSDLVNTGNNNASSPQFVTFAGTSSDNKINSVLGDNLRTAVLNYTTGGDNSIGTLSITNCNDNGLYVAQPGKISVGTLIYSGTDEPAVFIDGAQATVGTLIVDKANNAAFDWSNCTLVQIGTLIVRDPGISYLFRTRTTNVSSGTIRIGKILAEFTGIFCMWCDSGVTEHLSIGEADITYIHDPARAGSLGSWCRFNTMKSITIGRADITVIDKNDVLTSGDIFISHFPTSPTRGSHIGSFNVRFFKSDRTTICPAVFQGRNLIHPLIQVDNGKFQVNFGPYLREIIPDEPSSPGLYANTLPTLGTWRRGQVVFRTYPAAAGSPGWVCTAAGTPGTWGVMPSLA